MTQSQEIVYNYDYDDSNYYTDRQLAEKHPIDDVYCEPPYMSTRKKVPWPLPENKWPKLVDGDWVLVDSFKGTTYWLLTPDEIFYKPKTITVHEELIPEGALLSDPGPTLKYLKFVKRNELEHAYGLRTTEDIRYTSAAGVTRLYQANQASRDSLDSAISSYTTAEQVPAGYFWRSSDNMNTPFVFSDLVALKSAIENRNFALFARLSGYKDELNAITELSEAALIEEILWVDPET